MPITYQFKTYFKWRIKNLISSYFNWIFAVNFALLFILFFTKISIKTKVFLFFLVLILTGFLIEKHIYKQGEWRFSERKRMNIPTPSEIRKMKEAAKEPKRDEYSEEVKRAEEKALDKDIENSKLTGEEK